MVCATMAQAELLNINQIMVTIHGKIHGTSNWERLLFYSINIHEASLRRSGICKPYYT